MYAFRNMLAIAVMVVVVGIAPRADADQISNYVKDGVAIGGADPVAYFTDNKLEAGTPDFTAEWNGVTYAYAAGFDLKMSRLTADANRHLGVDRDLLAVRGADRAETAKLR